MWILIALACLFAIGVAIFAYEMYNAPLIGPDEEL